MADDADSRTLLLHESMLRFRCNQRGCCCDGWKIPLEPSDAARIIRVLDEDGAQAFIDHSTFLADHDGRVERVFPQDAKGNGPCFFLLEEGTCRLHRDHGVDALPGLCRAFPTHTELLGGSLELRFDAICPEVIERLADPGPYELAEVESSVVRERIVWSFVAPEVSIAGVDLSWAQLTTLRDRIIAAFNSASATALAVLARVNQALVRLSQGEPAETLEIRAGEPTGPFDEYLDEAVRAHSEHFLRRLLPDFRRFATALDLSALDPERLTAALRYDPAWRSAYDGAGPEVENLLRRYLCHRFFGLYERTPQLDSLGLAYGTINHSVATGLRFAFGLSRYLERPLDLACLKVGLGASEFLYRNKRLPVSAMPWFGIDTSLERSGRLERFRLN